MIPVEQFIDFGIRFGLPAYELKKPTTYDRFEVFCSTGDYESGPEDRDAPKIVKPSVFVRKGGRKVRNV